MQNAKDMMNYVKTKLGFKILDILVVHSKIIRKIVTMREGSG